MKKILSICMAVLIVVAMLAMTVISSSALSMEEFYNDRLYSGDISREQYDTYVSNDTDVLAPVTDENVDDDDTFNPDGNPNVDGDLTVDDDTTGNTSGKTDGDIVDDTTGNTGGDTKPVDTTDDKGETVTTATEAVTEKATETPAVPEKKPPVKTENPKTGNDMPVVAMLIGIALFCTASVMIRKRLTSK